MSAAIKICGVRTLDDAVFAVDAGAAMIGLNFYARSPRCVALDEARRIADVVRGRAETIGVFVNEPTPQAAIDKARLAGLDAVQLHGDEDAAYLSVVRRALPTIRAVRVGEGFDADGVARIAADRLLLDAATPLYGGSGLTVDWRAASALIALRPETILAGGLNADNVVEAMRASGARFLDVCSGVEQTPGVKDHEKIKRLMAAVAAGAEERA